MPFLSHARGLCAPIPGRTRLETIATDIIASDIIASETVASDIVAPPPSPAEERENSPDVPQRSATVRRLAATFAAALIGLSLAPAPTAAAVTGTGSRPNAPSSRAGQPSGGDEIPPRGSDDEPEFSIEVQREKARAELVDRLNRLATWCNDKELFIERDRIWRTVLEIAPDDNTARKGLRYARNVDGTWKEPAPRDLKNIGKKFLDDLVKREVDTYAPYGDALLAMAQAPGRKASERESLIAEIRTIAPNHAGLHQWLGDVQMGDRWVMPETVVAKERRAAIRDVVKRSIEVGTPLETVPPGDREKDLGVTWKVVLQGQSVRLLSTGTEEEAVRIARACEAAGTVLDLALGTEMRYPGGYTIYVLTNAGEKDAFLAKLPGLADDDRTRMGGLEGTGIPGSSNVALFALDPARRLDAAVRHTIGNVLGITLGVTHKTAWAWEGIGLYLTRELVGTRLTWFVSEDADPTMANLRSKLTAPESNWIQEAFDLLWTGTAVPLDDLLRRGLDRMDVPCALTGYALVAYLLEGKPESALEFVTRSARGDDPATISKEVLKRTPVELQERLVQWLSERY